jgi:heme oxygenase (biliverdin-IX-beta and delta-forming)
MNQTESNLMRVSPLAAPSTLLVRLRQETRQEHDAIEQALDLTGPALTLDHYRHQLERFYGFYAPLEAIVRSRWASLAGPSAVGPALAHTSCLSVRLNKAPFLQQDLRYLGVHAADLPLCPALPPLHTEAAVAGCLYVLEGATLGGRVISQHIAATLGITPLTGGRFFHGYGEDTGKLWQAMRHWLASLSSDTSTNNAVVASATATFASLRRWCEAASPRNLPKHEEHHKHEEHEAHD